MVIKKLYKGLAKHRLPSQATLYRAQAGVRVPQTANIIFDTAIAMLLVRHTGEKRNPSLSRKSGTVSLEGTLNPKP